MRAFRLQQKEAEESALLMERVFAYRRDYEAARDLEMEDDELFCPFNLLTEDDVSQQSCSCATYKQQLEVIADAN